MSFFGDADYISHTVPSATGYIFEYCIQCQQPARLPPGRATCSERCCNMLDARLTLEGVRILSVRTQTDAPYTPCVVGAVKGVDRICKLHCLTYPESAFRPKHIQEHV